MKNQNQLMKPVGCHVDGFRLSNFTLPALISGLVLSLFLLACGKNGMTPKAGNSMMAAVGPSVISVPSLAPVNLGTAGLFTILTQTGITTTGVTSIQGDIGVGPITAASMTGFGMTLDISKAFAKSSLVSGNLYGPDYTGGTTSAKMTQAISDMQAAFTSANMLTSPMMSSVAAAGNISGQSLQPGIYKYGSTLMIAGAGVTLNGGPNDVYVFQIGTGLTVAANTKITLTGGLNASNVFWIVGSAATFGTNANFSGIILAKTLVSLNTGDIFTGRIFAQTAVTMIANTVTLPLIKSLAPTAAPVL